MRLALITGRDATGKPLLLAEPGEPRAVADAYKRIITAPPADLAEIHLWDSHGGVIRRKRFSAVLPSPATAPILSDAPAPESDGGEPADLDDGPSLVADEASVPAAPPRRRR